MEILPPHKIHKSNETQRLPCQTGNPPPDPSPTGKFATTVSFANVFAISCKTHPASLCPLRSRSSACEFHSPPKRRVSPRAVRISIKTIWA